MEAAAERARVEIERAVAEERERKKLEVAAARHLQLQQEGHEFFSTRLRVMD